MFTVLLIAGMLWCTQAGQAALAANGGDAWAALKQLPGTHALLALAIALAGWLNALQLGWYLRRAGVYKRQPGWRRFLRQICVASLGMVLVVGALLWAWDGWMSWPWWQRVSRLAVVVGSGGVAYAGLLWLQGIRPRDLRGH
jgi:putative peptidoglycan lipid II flippase